MGKLVMFEIRKLFQQKVVWFFLIGVFVINLLMVYRTASVSEGDGTEYSWMEAAEFYQSHKNESNSQMLFYLESAGHSQTNLYVQIKETDHYNDILQKIQKEKKRLSKAVMFQKTNSFSYRNIIKVADRYAALPEQKLQAVQTYNIKSVTDLYATTVLLLTVVVLLVLRSVLLESEKNTISLIRPMRYGRQATITAKMISLALILFIIMLIFYAGNFCMGAYLYGIENLQRPIQCVAGYISSPFQISAGQYIIIFMLRTYLGILAVAQVFLFLCVMIRNSILSCLAIGVILFLETMIYQQMDNYSYLAPLKQINLVSGLDTPSYFRNYITVNFAGYPVEAGALSIVTIYMIIFCFSFGSIWLWCKKDMGYRRIKKTFSSDKKSERKTYSMSIFCHECFKLFISQKAVFVLICLGILQIASCLNFTKTEKGVGYYYRQYSKNLEGELSPAKEAYLKREGEIYIHGKEQEERYKKQQENGEISSSYADYMIGKLSETSDEKEGFLLAYNQYQWLKAKQEQGIEVQYIECQGYRQLLGTEQQDILDATKMLFVIVIGLVRLIPFERENQMNYVICSSKNGYRLPRYKISAAFLYILAAWGLAFIPRMILIGVHYSFPDLSGTSASLYWLENMPDGMPIWAALIIWQVVRIAGACIAGGVILLVTLGIKNSAAAVVTGLVLVLLPSMMCVMGLSGQWGIIVMASGKCVLSSFGM